MGKAIKIYVAPVSGGSFPLQLAYLSEIYEATKIYKKKIKGYSDYAPNLVFSSSGGNVASYIGLAADWSPSGIEWIASNLESEMFVTSWVRYIPAFLIAPFTGSVFRPGYGTQAIFKSIFTEVSIQRTEIWTGVYDPIKDKGKFFCNKCEDDALIILKEADKTIKINSLLSPSYLNGNVVEIADATTASASIPFITQEQKVEINTYADGGTIYSSPFSAMTTQIRDVIKHHKARLQLIYLCPSNEDEMSSYNLKLMMPIHSLIKGCLMRDRYTSVDLIHSLSKKVHDAHFPNADTETLAKVLKFVQKKGHYVLWLYPLENKNKLNITNFKGDQVVECIRKAREKYGIYVWYSRSGKIH
jgi:hypothetical protein